MKYFLYDEVQIGTMKELLNNMKVEGVQQAKLLVMLETVLDKGKLMKKEEERDHGDCNSTEVSESEDKSGHNSGEEQHK